MVRPSYNRIDPDNPDLVYHQCRCGWKSRKWRSGGSRKSVIFSPFCCPKCGKELSRTTVVS